MKKLTRMWMCLAQSLVLASVGVTMTAQASVQSPIVTDVQAIDFVQAGSPFSLHVLSVDPLYAGIIASDTTIAVLEIFINDLNWHGYIAVRPDIGINPASSDSGFVATNKTDPNAHVRYYLSSLDTLQQDPVSHWLYLPLQGNGGTYSQVMFNTKGEQMVTAGDYHLAVEAGTYNP
ncbi:TPA: hypothetical protein ACKP36_004388 [Serratia marcescens]|uniref:hypothetical protein n=1 Tax=Serratia marcescens TaxID=615 RepID=UPI00301C83EB